MNKKVNKKELTITGWSSNSCTKPLRPLVNHHMCLIEGSSGEKRANVTQIIQYFATFSHVLYTNIDLTQRYKLHGPMHNKIGVYSMGNSSTTI